MGQWRLSSLGEGYVSFVDSILGAVIPETPISVLNAGIRGNRGTDLAARWQSDVLDLEPEQYESVYRSVLAKTRPQLDGLVLMTPYFLETNRKDLMREKMDAYGAITKKLAVEFDAISVDTQLAFNHYLRHQPTESLCADRVHPNGVVHMILARAFLSAVGVG